MFFSKLTSAVLVAVLGAWAFAAFAQGETTPQRSTSGAKLTLVEGPHQISPPALQFNASGGLQVAWFEKHHDKRSLRTVRVDQSGAVAGSPVLVNPMDAEPDALHQAPGLSVGSAGDVFLTWATPKTGETTMFAADLVLARSQDGSKFGSPVRANDDGKAINHTFEQVLAGGDDVYLAWLDNRHKDKSGAAAIFACSRDGGKTIEKNLTIDGMACPCCRPSVALAPDGTLWVAWRKTFDGNVRDIVLARSADRGRTFSAPILVHQDGWAFPACPHRGPSIGFDRSGRLYLGWYTEGKDEQPRLLFTTSDDQGKTFSSPRSLHTSTTSLPDQLRMVVHPDGAVLAVWEEVTGVRKRVVLRISNDRGTSFEPVQVLSEGAKAETPAVAVNEQGAVAVAWTEHAWPNNRIVLQMERLNLTAKVAAHP